MAEKNVVRPEIDDKYIERMEDVLATYERPLSYKETVVCLDEKPIQLLKNINSTSRLVRRGKTRRKDYEYKRKGIANAFCIVEPKRGRHMVKITKNRKADQFAEVMRTIHQACPRIQKFSSRHKLWPRPFGGTWPRWGWGFDKNHPN